MVGGIFLKDISKAAEQLYDGVFSAYEFVPEKNEDTGIVISRRIRYIADEPCRISFRRIDANKQSRFPGYKKQDAVLFASAKLLIKEGSDISVLQEGRTYEYELSGMPAVYRGHQEVALKPKNVG